MHLFFYQSIFHKPTYLLSEARGVLLQSKELVRIVETLDPAGDSSEVLAAAFWSPETMLICFCFFGTKGNELIFSHFEGFEHSM